MIFGSKAQNLHSLKIKSIKIPKFIFFKLKDYKKNKKKYINKIKKQLDKNVAVRSSNYFEDKSKNSLAGKFLSILNVNSKSEEDLINSIKKVENSYKIFQHPDNEILIQNMVKNVKYSGVIFTLNPENLSPYFKINYTKSSNTSLVTSGTSFTETITYFKNANIYFKEKFLKKLIILTKKLIKFTKKENLDIEFCVSKDNKINILQVRELKIKKNKIFEIKQNLTKLEKKITKLQRPHAHLLGKTTYFGVMPDWNPAEIIGIRPNPLDLSIYKELITDHVWSQNRKFFGYKDVTSCHLMTTFFGTPYIDLRVDFNSWLPAKLSNKLSNKLIDFYLNKFKKNIYLHDKIEFDIVFTCLNFSSSIKLNELFKFDFNKKEIEIIKNNLRKISNLTFNNFYKLKDNFKTLENRFRKINNSRMYTIDKIYWLIEDCKRFGTYPFAGFARCSFVAMNFLDSMVEQKIINIHDKELFLGSIKNIATNIQLDFSKISKKAFIEKYGHIRPNTYDIRSLNYKKGFKFYFKKSKSDQINKKKVSGFKFDKIKLEKIDKLIKKNKLNIESKELIKFIEESIKLREYSKFLFTRNVNAILENITKLSSRMNINNNDSSYLDITDIVELYYSLDNHNLEQDLKSKIKKRKIIFNDNLKITLPEVITSPRDIYLFKSLPTKINFVGDKIIEGQKILIEGNNIKNLNLNNKIVLIEKADPGYDFIFSHKILGLITKFGGVNSHMSIRCSELGVQAAIGIGEKNFVKLTTANRIQINGKNQTLTKII
jgi:glutamine kinase